MGLVARCLGREPLPAASSRRPPALRTVLRGSATAAAALCGGGLLLGIPGAFVVDPLEPVAGVALLVLAARSSLRARRAP